MGTFNRALLTLFSLALSVVFGVLVIVAAFFWTTPFDYLLLALANKDQRLIFGVISLIFLVISFKFLITSLTLKEPPKHAIIQENTLGTVRISLGALENLVRKLVSQYKEVREVKPRVQEFPEGVSIYLQIIVSPDIKIPTISEEIQKMLREKIFETTGVTVIDVKILIDNISSSDLKSRVE